MNYRTIGSTNLHLSEIVFGAWAAGGWMWGGSDRRDSIAAIRAAYELGVTSIDTAPIYGQGESEEIVGDAIRGIPRSKIQLLTKFGMRWDVAKGDFAFKSKDNKGKEIDIYKYASRDSVIRECEDSLRRLGTDYIDLYQMHWPESVTPIYETMEAVALLIKQGKVRHAGVCNYSVPQMQEAERTIPLASNQVPYSMVKRGIENEVVPYCLKNKKGILAYSPLERGLLTGKMTPGYKFKEGDHRAANNFFKDENIRRTGEFLSLLQPLAKKKHATLSQIVLRWTLEQPGISVVLVGARNQEQAIENAKASRIMLSKDELDMMSTALNTLEIVRE